MLELLKILAEVISKLVSPEAISAARRTKKLNEIGTDIFLLYSNLNSIIVHGWEILSEFERGIGWMRRKVADGEPERVYFHSVDLRLRQQLHLLHQFVSAYRRLAYQLEVIEPEAALGLEPIIAGKMNVLSLLQHMIPSQGGPISLVSIDEVKMRMLMSMAQSTDPKDLRMIHAARLGFNQLISDLILESGISDVSNITASQYPLVERYLAGPAKDNLKELERYAKLLRAAIEKHFSLQDILLNVGDRRAAS